MLSEKQRAIMKRIGVDPDSVNFSCARRLIASYFEKAASEPPTEGQCWRLRKMGFDPADFTKKTASQKIGEHFSQKATA